MTEAEIQQAISTVEAIGAAALTGVGQPLLAALLVALGEASKAVDAAIQSPSAATSIEAELVAGDAAADVAEGLKFPKG